MPALNVPEPQMFAATRNSIMSASGDFSQHNPNMTDGRASITG